MTPVEVAKLVAVLCSAFPNAKITGETSKAYELMLGDLEYLPSQAAIEQLLATGKWLPTVAEIRERVLTFAIGDPPSGGEAWGKLLKAIGRYGRNRQPGIDFEIADPLIAKCVASFSWRELCDSENQVADRARFIELYEQLATHQRRRQLSENLPAMQRLRAVEAQRHLRSVPLEIASPSREDGPVSLGELLVGMPKPEDL